MQGLSELVCHQDRYLQPAVFALLDASGYLSLNTLPAMSASYDKATQESYNTEHATRLTALQQGWIRIQTCDISMLFLQLWKVQYDLYTQNTIIVFDLCLIRLSIQECNICISIMGTRTFTSTNSIMVTKSSYIVHS